MEGPYIAEIAALVGDPARANILVALMGGQALTAGELAYHAGVGASTTSGHLAKLVDGGLLTVNAQGRHRYYRLASQDVARLLELLMGVASTAAPRFRPRSMVDDRLAEARSCYNHLAGRIAVALVDRLQAQGHIHLDFERGAVTPSGARFFAEFGIEISQGAHKSSPCRPCLDWSERKPHLGGKLGAALLDRLETLRWLERPSGTRAVLITDLGREGLSHRFGVDFGASHSRSD